MKTVTFDPSLQADRDQFQWLYCTWNVEPRPGQTEVIRKQNLNILDALDRISVEDVTEPPWAHMDHARKLREGVQTLELPDLHFDALISSIRTGGTRWFMSIQGRFIRPLLERLEAAKNGKPEPQEQPSASA